MKYKYEDNALGGLIIDAILWCENPGKAWGDLYTNCPWPISTRNTQLAQFLVAKYSMLPKRTLKVEKKYCHALSLIEKYYQRFNYLPSVELLKSLL